MKKAHYNSFPHVLIKKSPQIINFSITSVCPVSNNYEINLEEISSHSVMMLNYKLQFHLEITKNNTVMAYGCQMRHSTTLKYNPRQMIAILTLQDTCQC